MFDDKYIPLAYLTKGSQGEVCSVRDKETGKVCVAKSYYLESHMRRELEMTLRFKEQAHEHHLVSVIEKWEDFVIFEMVSGKDMFYRKPNPMTFDLVEKFMKDMLDALITLEKVGVAHRDFKLENVIYDPENKTFTLIDFGLACTSDNMFERYNRTPGNKLGWSPSVTKSYYSKLQPSFTELLCSDVFALGQTCFELLNGKEAYEEKEEYGINDFSKPNPWVWKCSNEQEEKFRNLIYVMLEGRLLASEIKY
jgi:serine/threonine protein kinase